MPVVDQFEDFFGDVKKVLVVLAHPDDAEIVCGGTIARLIDSGRQVRLVVTTNGGKGTQDKEGVTEQQFAADRLTDQQMAGEILGIPAAENFNLGITDGEMEYTVANIEKVVFHIRQFQPDLVITHNPQDVFIQFNETSSWVNHRDHRHTGLATTDAVYPYARDRGFFPEQLAQGLSQHIVNKILISDAYGKSNVFYFEITNYVDKKLAAIKAHDTAMNPDSAQDFIDENEIEGKYFEPLGFWGVY